MAIEKVYKNNAWEKTSGNVSEGSFVVNMWGENATFYWQRTGNMVHLSTYTDFNSAKPNYSQTTSFMQVPANLIPKKTCQFVVMAFTNSNSWSSGTYYPCLFHILNTDGSCYLRGNDTEMKKMRGLQVTCTYIAKD